MGVFRQREYRVLRQLSARQLAPKPVVYRDGWLSLNLPAQFIHHWQNMDPRRRSPALLRWHHHFQRKAPPDLLA